MFVVEKQENIVLDSVSLPRLLPFILIIIRHATHKHTNIDHFSCEFIANRILLTSYTYNLILKFSQNS